MIPSVIGYRSGIGSNAAQGIDSDGLNDLNAWNGLNEIWFKQFKTFKSFKKLPEKAQRLR
jgi:hypothetical protein